ncbi:MAG: HAD family hydrolase [Methylosarcina sp.]
MTQAPHAIDCIVFDLGRVLIDLDFEHAFEYWANASGQKLAEVRNRFVLDEPYYAQERGEIMASQYFSHLRKTLGIDLSDEDFLFGWNAIFLEPMNGIQSLLEELRPLKPLHVFSNTNAAHQEFWSQRYANLLSPFQKIVCSHELRARKPNEEAFLQLATQLSSRPERILFFDDLPENAAGARSAGLYAHCVGSVAEIRRILAKDYLFPIGL